MAKNKTGKTHPLKRFLPYYKPYTKDLVFDLFCAALTTMCELALPLIVRNITGRAESEPETLTVTLILTFGGVYLLMRLIDTLAYYFMANRGHIVGAKMETDMRPSWVRKWRPTCVATCSDTCKSSAFLTLTTPRSVR